VRLGHGLIDSTEVKQGRLYSPNKMHGHFLRQRRSAHVRCQPQIGWQRDLELRVCLRSCRDPDYRDHSCKPAPATLTSLPVPSIPDKMPSVAHSFNWLAATSKAWESSHFCKNQFRCAAYIAEICFSESADAKKGTRNSNTPTLRNLPRYIDIGLTVHL